MKVFDFLIIYLACGAPVGVYFYLQNRRRLFSKQLWLKTILNFLFWIPFVLQIIRNSVFFHKFFPANSDSTNKISTDSEKRIYEAQKKIENIIYENEINISVYEFREVCDRFVGLSIAALHSTEIPGAHEKEIFRIAFRQSTELSARCFHRRNRNRLFFHQTQAEKDFLQTIANIADSISARRKFLALTLEIVTVLRNDRARDTITRMFENQAQTERLLPVKQLEKDLWNSARRLPQNAHPISLESPIINRRAKSSVKD
jgi:hypothetical protein